MEHCVYLLPMCVDLVLPAQYPPQLSYLGNHFPHWVPVFKEMYWILAPFAFFTIGNYNLDSKNTYCFFPGFPYFCRVVTTNIAQDDDSNSQKANLRLIRRWAMSKNPPPNTSTHFWYHDLPPVERGAFNAVANCYQIAAMFRELFSEKHVNSSKCLQLQDAPP